MDDMKDKMKGFMKKVNNPFSSSPASFRGQGRVLGSGSSSSTPSNSTLLNPRTPPVRPNVKPVPQSKSIPKPTPDPNPSQFSPYDSLISSSSSTSTSISSPSPFQCPVCACTFPTESDVSSHLDSCLTQQPESIEPGKGASHKVEEFLSGNPTENSVEVMKRLLGNLVKEPSNEKFRRIRMGNPKIREAIGEAKGGVEVLESVGFKIGDEEGELWATMEMPSEEGIGLVKEAVELLERWRPGVNLSFSIRKTVHDDELKEEPSKSASVESSVPAEPVKIDRKVRVFFCVSETAAARIELPDSFYSLSAEEVRRDAEMRRKKLADSQLLIPKSYREKQALAAKRRYKRTLIRIQFPDGVLLQGEFLPWETTSALYEFVSCALKEPGLEFELLRPGLPRMKLVPHFAKPGEKSKTLEEEDLVPSALLKFKPVETDSIVFTGLTDELLESSEPL
ncbi:hypothetical protein LUZ61_009517 [Rhynchospora tenuis]|uniref:UBX domain-containing protein n=1 Tax=Rhynchospora tenuis TaxID=198213 RepID=A0AAD5ZXC7_9POAL|nr:hypothetical protein LUZ61_009517 [Rhynchospora tenuis]